MSDKLVFDLAQEIEGSPNVFIRKDWINILDNQNQNYNNNQSIIDTSQLSNSNKYMSYREAYLLMPLTLTLGSIASYAANGINLSTGVAGTIDSLFCPGPPAGAQTKTSPVPTCMGLKNWFGQIIHSITLDYNGTTIIQQTPYINMWNSFKLMTTLSLDDINTQGSTIGFYPDDAGSFEYNTSGIANGTIITSMAAGNGICNNSTAIINNSFTSAAAYNYRSGLGNTGLVARYNSLIFDPLGVMQTNGIVVANVNNTIVNSSNIIDVKLSFFTSQTVVQQLWKSYIYNKQNQTLNAYVNATTNLQNQAGFLQIAVTAIIYLKHVHSFFNMVPLLKGVFMKMTLNLNNSSTNFSVLSNYTGAQIPVTTQLIATQVSVPIGGVNPLMISSTNCNLNAANGAPNYVPNGGTNLTPGITPVAITNSFRTDYIANLSVGARVLNSTLSGINNIISSTLAQSVYLYIPAYDFNPVFESAYLSSPVKTIRYTDIYQYQVLNVKSGNQFNNLLSNGIRNIKSILILPFYSTSAGPNISVNYNFGAPATITLNNININANTGFLSGTPVFQSPFDTAGTGTTSPFTWLTNFNIQVSGQNAIYNTQKYNFEQFNNQLYGQNSVNGGLTDGLTSGLIDRAAFDLSYCYYYVNIERMRPVEMSVPKSIQILGQNQSSHDLDLYCFIEYGNQIDIDVITGARVG